MKRPKWRPRFFEQMKYSNHLLYLTQRAHVLLFTYDLVHQQFTFMNPACITFFGLKTDELSLQEIKPTALLEMVSADDKTYVLSKLQAFLEGENIKNIEFRVAGAENERWLKVSPYLIVENDERLIVGQAEDITISKTTIELLNNHNMKKNSILTILAHDLAGPIGTVKNLSTMLGRETAALNNPRVEQFIHLITKISDSNIRLIRNYLDQEFLESSDTILYKKRVELVRKINIATENILKMQEKLKVEFIFKTSHERIYVEIDEDKFMQVINNLITNSLKFTPDGGRIELTLQDDKTDVLLTVSDTGVGIPPQFHSTLFDKFTPARRPGLKGQASNGLGMSIIKTIVQWHQGTIWFESEENVGTTFYIKIPVENIVN